MRFAEPALLWALLAVPAVALGGLWLLRWRRRAVRAFGDPDTLDRLSTGPGPERRGGRLILLLVAATALPLAMARPQWGRRLEEVRRRGIDLVLVMDISRSMLAQDLRPSRLEQAKEAMGDLIDRLPDDRIGLVAFAGSAQVFCPLTLDHAAARVFLDILDPTMIQEPGTALGDAIRMALSLFDPGERKYKVMVLITDGEDQETEPLKAAEEAAEAGVIVFAVGVGTQSGEPIPLKDDSGEVVDYVRDQAGQIVTSRLNSVLLEEIARSSGGSFYLATPGEQELDRIAEEIASMDRKELSSRLAGNLEDRYQIPLVLATLALIAEAFLARRSRGSKVAA